ncbi:hypothetical protein QBC47DRAFT_395267 [Echria macrotheca]|uniref:Uncharacterized protein n=1 Tax=Echria macrotheca TaxID=438768 RepID=A0AAJ0B216_9PEZI|nr:hypothetical protein QBC47DRAFT_395267 [Echria macrotheca]
MNPALEDALEAIKPGIKIWNTSDRLQSEAGDKETSTAGNAEPNAPNKQLSEIVQQLRLMDRHIEEWKSEFSSELTRRQRTETENLSTFFRNIGAISTLGSGFTFTLIVSTLQDPAQVSSTPQFDASTVRIFIAISWLLFTIALIASILLAVFVAKRNDRDDNESRQWLAVCVLYPLEFGAFVFLALTVAGYVDVVGFLTLGIVVSPIVMVMILLLCLALLSLGDQLGSRFGQAVRDFAQFVSEFGRSYIR